MQRRLWLCCFFLLFQLFLTSLVLSNNHDNPANVIVDMINKNRTAHKLAKLNDNPGLGCMALQYVEFCDTNCTENDTAYCKPSEDDFAEIFAPNCGVELPTLGQITGRVVGCRKKYADPSVAFSEILMKHRTVFENRSHHEVGVGLVGAKKRKGPFFWCVLFGGVGGRANTTFVLENRGLGIKQKRGCYSGTDFPCSAGFKASCFSVVSVLSILFHYSVILF